MGITGLLPLLRSCTESRHISEYRDRCVGVDGFAWLHRAAHSCASDLALQRGTDRHIQWCLARLRLLLHHRITPLVVFDGASFSSKQATEKERSVRRIKEAESAIALMKAGQTDAAQRAFQRCVTIDASCARALQLACARELPTVQFLYAPYEADAQLAYLSAHNYIHAVVSEDSDLLVFGCTRVFYKMDNEGNGSEILLSNVARCTEVSLSSLTHGQFQEMAVLSGCDYLPSLDGMGLKKSHALIKSCKSWQRAIRKLRLSGKWEVPADYETQFEKALLCFRHQTVFDPHTQLQTSLTIISSDTYTRFPDLTFLGPICKEKSISIALSRGDLHPNTLEPFVATALRLHEPRERMLSLLCLNTPLQPEEGDAVVTTVRQSWPRSTAAHPVASLEQNKKINAYFIGCSEQARKPFKRHRTVSLAEQPISHVSTRISNVNSEYQNCTEAVEIPLAPYNVPQFEVVETARVFAFGSNHVAGHEEVEQVQLTSMCQAQSGMHIPNEFTNKPKRFESELDEKFVNLTTLAPATIVAPMGPTTKRMALRGKRVRNVQLNL